MNNIVRVFSRRNSQCFIGKKLVKHEIDEVTFPNRLHPMYAYRV